MKLEELFDLTLREILDNYCALVSLECDYVYGITTEDVAVELSKKYNLDDEVSLVAEPLIDYRLLEELMESDNEVLTFEKIDKFIEDNLMIEKRENNNG